MSTIKIPLNYMISPVVLNEIAMKSNNFKDFLDEIKKLEPDKYTISYDALQVKKINKYFMQSNPIRLRRYIFNRLGGEKYMILENKIYAGVYTITAFIRSGEDLYVKLEMPEDTTIPFHELSMSSDQWKFFFGQVKKIYPI